MIDWAWVGDHLDDLVYRTIQHLVLTGIAVAAGFAVSFGLALWSMRRRSVYGPIIALTGIAYTIPSVAMIALLVPITGLSIADGGGPADPVQPAHLRPQHRGRVRQRAVACPGGCGRDGLPT